MYSIHSKAAAFAAFFFITFSIGKNEDQIQR